MIRDLVASFKAYWEAWKIIVDQKLWLYLFIPGLISLFYGLLVGFSAWYWSDNLKDFVFNVLPSGSNSKILSRITSGFLGIGIATTGVVVYKYVILSALSPILMGLSKRVEEAVMGYSISYKKETNMSTLDDLGRSILFGLRNFVKEFGITLIILILSLITILGFIAAPIIFLVQAMYVGFSNLDFTLNRYFSINGSVDFIRKNLGFSLGNGVAFMLIIMIPVVGLFFAPTLGAAAATLKAVPRIYRPSFT
ncbi:MAG: EI24 domain-containing protein [Saprospiraceae bacterium]|nr:EI24 domain-containing protein [Saprospiraceae bacterium]